MPMLEDRTHPQIFWGTAGPARCQPLGRKRRRRCHSGAQRLRQDHPAALRKLLETADSGTLRFDGESFDLAHLAHKDIARLRRKTAFVFQNYNLFRNKTALQNVTEGLIVARKVPKEQAEQTGLSCWKRSAWQTVPERTPGSCPVGSSSGWPLPGHWPLTRR